MKTTSFWQNDTIVWEEGIKEMYLVMKDDSGGFLPRGVRVSLKSDFRPDISRRRVISVDEFRPDPCRLSDMKHRENGSKRDI